MQHKHEHRHGHEHEHSHTNNQLQAAPGEVTVSITRHEEALVVSGAAAIYIANTEQTRCALRDELSKLAKTVEAQGGIIGHVKASFSVTENTMLSITDIESGIHIKPPTERAVAINAVAIVFGVSAVDAYDLMQAALTNTIR